MLFNSLPYLVFLASVCAAYRVLGLRGQNRLLLFASYFFYAWWDIRFLLLIVLSTSLDFACGLMMERGRLTTRERVTPSLWAVSAAVLCVGIDWSAVSRAGIDLPALAPDAGAAGVVAAVVATVAVGNALHGRVAGLSEPRRRRLLVTTSIVCNLGVLGFFKYFDFFVGSAEALVRELGWDPAPLRLGLILPVGISFYTFQTLSYSIDVYRREVAPASRFSELALYVAFFPQLVAGPIERAARLLPALQQPRRLSADQTFRGLHQILLGLFKKVAIADGVAVTVDQIFASPAPTWIEVIVGSALFGLQIYCDFSGYTDIARGSARLLGIELTRNFDVPYFSRNPREFWRRWHISLSTWLRDYVYIPLGGSRYGALSTYRNLLVTMLLGGLWHGAAWTFLLWGLYHGALLCLHRGWQAWCRKWKRGRFPALPHRLGALVSMGLCLAATGYGWMIFRAESLAQVVDFTAVLGGDFGNLRFDARLPRFPVAMGLPVLIALEVLQYVRADAEADRGLVLPVRGLLYASLVFTLLVGVSSEPAKFIYFAF